MTSGDKIRYFFEPGAFNDKGEIINSSKYCGVIKMVTSVFFVSVDIELGCSHTKLKITGHINKLV